MVVLTIARLYKKEYIGVKLLGMKNFAVWQKFIYFIGQEMGECIENALIFHKWALLD